MNPLDSRAIENIATAPATDADRRWASGTSSAIVALFLLSIPFAARRLPAVPAFIPAVVGVGVVTLLLTAVLVFVQYRLERDLRLALLAIAYAFATVTQTLYLLTFPNVFASNGLLGAGPQSASWAWIISQIGFAAFLSAHGAASRRGWRLSVRRVAAVATASAVVALALIVLTTAGHAYLPAITNGDAFTPLWTRIAAPVAIAATLIALVVVSDGLATVTEVWLAVVLLARALAIVTAGEFASGRYSAGWYAARIEEVLGDALLLTVFLVKINELMIRLAARSRSTAEALAVGEARYASLANVVPQLIWTTNGDGEIEYVNDRWVAYTGYEVHGSRDGGWRAALHPDDELAVRARWQHSLRTGEPFAAEYRLREGATGRYRWFLVNAVPVRERRGAPVAWIGTCTDVDTQKRLEEREAFLARAGERLGASLDVTATVAAVRALLIPRLAERCWIALLDDDRRFVLVALGSTDRSDEFDGRAALNAPLPPPLQHAVSAIVDAAEPVVLERTDRFPDRWINEVPPSAAMIVPLVNAETTIGVLALMRGSGRGYDADDLALVREFARRAALSLEHARLYERERTTANTLQLAMLPAQLPHLPSIRFSASYSAASESQRVGGDFYDAFELPDGRVAVTIGDVTGHGLEAAVIMGEIRQALRAAAFEAIEPSAILDRASRLLVASGRTVFVTAIFGVLDPLTARFAYATAGHPPPLVIGGDDLRRLPSSGLPIGLRDDEGVDFALRLKAPCTLVMFTDGLMEFARDIDEGERRIEQAVRELAGEDIDHLANAVMKAVLGEDEATDDIAILTVTIDGSAGAGPGDEREWRFSSSDARTGAMVRRAVGALVREWTGRDDLRYAGELAYGELIANAVRHAPGPVRVIAVTDGAAVTRLIVEDSGAGFRPQDERADPFAESGRGLRLVRAVADDVAIEPLPGGGTRVSVTFGAPVPAAVSSGRSG